MGGWWEAYHSPTRFGRREGTWATKEQAENHCPNCTGRTVVECRYDVVQGLCRYPRQRGDSDGE